MPVPIEAVDQRAVEAGEAADVLREQLAEILDPAGPVQAPHEGAQPRVQRVEAGLPGGVVGLLQLQDEEVVDPVRRDLVGLARGAEPQRDGAQVEGAVLLRTRIAVAFGERGEFGIGALQGRADRCGRGCVRARLEDDEASRIEGEQEAVRLDAAHDVDRLAVAGGEVDVLGGAACSIQVGHPSGRRPARPRPDP